jgi:hypothetical protein
MSPVSRKSFIAATSIDVRQIVDERLDRRRPVAVRESRHRRFVSGLTTQR